MGKSKEKTRGCRTTKNKHTGSLWGCLQLNRDLLDLVMQSNAALRCMLSVSCCRHDVTVDAISKLMVSALILL